MENRKIEDAVKNLWILVEEENKMINIEEFDRDVIELLLSKGYAFIKDDTIALTPKGKELGKRIVRLHRLTERLLLDVLRMEEEVFEEASCSVEHAITEELEEAICTLLGHPKMCPHGKRIPPGRCCSKKREKISRVVYAISELEPGDEGRISYIVMDRFNILSRLTGMGLIPGARLKLLRKKPSYVIEVGNRQITFDNYIARSIYVIKLPTTNNDN